MEVIKKLLKKLSKNILAIIVVMVTVAVTIYTIAQAVEGDSNGIIAAQEVERQLTSEEIDKIIQDLKASGNIDNILSKLEEIIKRAELSGNTALKEYATNVKTAYELQKELDAVKGLIEAMKKKNTEIEAVDKQVSKILSATTIIEDLRGAVSEEAMLILESLTEDQVKELQELLAEISTLIDLNDIGSLSINQRSLLDVLVLDEIIKKNMLDDEERVTLAKDALSVAVTILQSYEKQRYSDVEFSSLAAGSDEFVKYGRKAGSVLAEQVVFFDGFFNMRRPPVMYDGHILVAMDDLYQYIDAKVEYMYNNATMVIQSPGKTLEIVSGKNVAYLNDEPKSMPVPVLNFRDTIYISAEFFAQAYDMGYKYVEEHEFFVIYKNLVQLSNPSVPNAVNRD